MKQKKDCEVKVQSLIKFKDVYIHIRGTVWDYSPISRERERESNCKVNMYSVIMPMLYYFPVWQ